MKQPPGLDLRALETLLARRPTDVASRIRQTVSDIRPCIEARSVRAGNRPLRVGGLARLFGQTAAAALLPPLASKFGGTPYVERDDEIGDARFLGQINFAEITSQLTAENAPLPAAMPQQGLLAIDLLDHIEKTRVRWYPGPEEKKYREPGSVQSVGRFEAAIEFSGGWSLRGLGWFDDVPEGDDELWEFMNDFEVEGVDQDAYERCHKLFGHTNEILNEFFDVAAAKPSATARDYELLWRITFDNPADLAWGTNWLYVVIHKDDLSRGLLGNAVVMVANA